MFPIQPAPRRSSSNPFRPIDTTTSAVASVPPPLEISLSQEELAGLTKSQALALPLLAGWVQHPTEQVFRLFGAAGTGKTHIVARLMAMFTNLKFAVVTLSGKAALVLQRASGLPAQTIHSMMYTLEGQTGDGELLFRQQPDHVARDADIIIVDEASMVDNQMGADLLGLHKPILVIADPNQLPPIHGEGAFMTKAADASLRDIVRQAANSPILRMSADALAGRQLRKGEYGHCYILRRTDLELEHVLAADQILVGKNETARRYNRRIRELHRYSPDGPVPGDKLIGLRNDPAKGLINGSMWRVKQSQPARTSAGRDAFELELDSLDFLGTTRKFVVDAGFFVGDDPSLALLKRSRAAFAYGYAITVHKAQGSQWDNVLVIDEAFGEKERWRYTAITRASHTVHVVVR